MQNLIKLQFKVFSTRFSGNFTTYCHKKANALSILGLCENTTLQDIKKAFCLLSKKFHPDVTKNYAEFSKFLEVKEAYTYLKQFYEENDNGNDTFNVQNSHMNSYDGKINPEDIEAFKKYKEDKKRRNGKEFNLNFSHGKIHNSQDSNDFKKRMNEFIKE